MPSGDNKNTGLSKRRRLETIRAELCRERASFIPHWRDLSDNILPRRSRFFVSDANKGDKRNQKIIDSTGSIAARTLRAGMMGGVTSPSRPWFSLGAPDPELAEFEPVKQWLHFVTKRMANIFLKSNLYQVLPIVYGDIGTFSVSAMEVMEDKESVVRFGAYPVGSYAISTNEKGQVRVFMRELQMTVRQIIEEFGRREDGSIDFDRFSSYIKNLYDQDLHEAWVEVVHFILPNEEHDESKIDPKYKKYASVYYERGAVSGSTQVFSTSVDNDKFLRESGFDFFPVMAPRWEVSGEDIYGTSCPGMVALGDIKQLQLQEKRSAQAIEKMINPPMVGPSALKTSSPTILPGGITYSDTASGQQGFRPAHEVNFRIGELEQKQQQIRQRIQRAYYEDLFQALITSDRRQITAREVEEISDEKLLAIGPVLEQINQDLLDPLIDNTFNIMLKQGLIPEPPQEIQGQDLRVEYVSIMAQAQKLIGLSSLERFTQYVANVAQADPQVLDKVNTDQLVDEYSERVSLPPGIVKTDDEVEEVRAARAKAQQQAQQMEAIQQASGAAKDLSQANTSGDNALTGVIDAVRQGQ